MSKPEELLYTKAGGVELLDGEGNTLWASDSDDDFRARFPELLTEADQPLIDDYLVDKGLIAPGTELWISDETDEAEA